MTLDNVLSQEAHYVYRKGGSVWVSEPGKEDRTLLESPKEGESANVKWMLEVTRLQGLGFKEPLQYWVLP